MRCLRKVRGRWGEVMSEIVTAGILVIGDEILSGRTKDKNIGFIAEYLTNIGIDLKEVRVVADEESDIVDALNALRNRYTYVFTTGGIGPTHDEDKKPNTNLVVRSRDPEKLNAAMAAVKEMLANLYAKG